MTDRENVIKKVTAIVADMQEEVDEWKDYSDWELRDGLTCDCDWWYKTLQTLKDTLALLKEQEPVKPVVDIDTWKCGNCGHTLEHQQLLGDNVLFHEQYNYCQNCGKEVKWE